MSFVSELKRRNVIRVAIAYLVAAWLLLQIADVLVPLLELPATVGKALFGLLVIGFIPAVIFSWAYEITPDGVKRDRDVAPEDSIAHQTARKLDAATIGMLALVAALVIYDRAVPTKSEPAPASTTGAAATSADEAAETGEAAIPAGTTATAAGGGAPSVAVLPFTNMSPDPDNEYFADGISEELLNLLVDVDGLRVPSRTSSFAFKGRNMDIREIAAQLKVGHVLEGSVRKAGNQVRITAQLIDVDSDTHLWSETYDRELEDIFAIQDEIAGQIVGELSSVLDLVERSEKPTDNLEAYTLYLRGRHLFQQREAGLTEAERLLREAVSLDPEFAEAWGTLATTCVNLPNYVSADPAESKACAREAAERALALDSSLAEPRLALAQIHSAEGDFSAAMAMFEDTIHEHPSHSLARLWYGIDLMSVGYLAQGLEQIETAAGLDPSYGLMLDWLSRAYLTNNELDRVVELAVRAMELGRQAAGVPLLYRFLAEGSLEDVRRFVDLDDELNWGQARWLFTVREDRSRLDEALAWTETQRSLVPDRITAYHQLGILMTGGSSQQAFDQLRVVRSFDSSIISFMWLPSNRRHIGSEAMKAFSREVGLETIWRDRGWPDLCRPVGDDDFECEG